MDQAVKEMLKREIDITDADFDKLSPGMLDLLGSIQNYRLVAEVTESKYCLHGLKVGDRFVIEVGKLNLQASTAAPCVGALAPIYEMNLILMHRLSNGLKPDGSVIGYSRCHDMGVDHGGLGEVYFRVYTEQTT